MTPEVSVVVPVFNGEKFIGQAIRSVLNQTFSDFELIIVDDCSTDSTVEVVKSFSDSRIRLIQHEKNRGPGAARNTAIEIAEGRWVAILDSDDAWHESRLAQLLDIARSHPNSFVADDLMICFSTPSGELVPWKTEFARRGLKKGPRVFSLSLDRFITLEMGVMKPMFPIEQVRKQNVRYLDGVKNGEDLEFQVQLFRSGLDLFLLNEPLYYFRLRGRSLSISSDRPKDELTVYKRLIALEGIDESAKEALYEIFRKKSQYLPFAIALKNGKWLAAIKHTIRSPSVVLRLLSRIPEWSSRRFNAYKVKGSFR